MFYWINLLHSTRFSRSTISTIGPACDCFREPIPYFLLARGFYIIRAGEGEDLPGIGLRCARAPLPHTRKVRTPHDAAAAVVPFHTSHDTRGLLYDPRAKRTPRAVAMGHEPMASQATAMETDPAARHACCIIHGAAASSLLITSRRDSWKPPFQSPTSSLPG
jgi:hypothetical protein